MATIAEIRQQYPQYQDMSDQQIAEGLHKKFYNDMPRDQFFAKIGVAQNMNQLWGDKPAPTTVSNQPTPLAPEIDRLLAQEAQSNDPNNARTARVEQHIRAAEQPSFSKKIIDSFPLFQLVPKQSFEQGVTFGAADELKAAIRAGTGQGNYDELLQAEREQLNRIRKDNPVTSVAGEVIGAMTNPISRTSVAAQAPTWLARLGLGAAEAGTLAGIYGFNQGEGGFQNRVANAGTSALIAAPIGGALNAALPAVRASVTQTPGSQVAAAAERQGIQLPRAVTSDNPATQQAGKIASNVPWAGQPLRQASQNAIQQLDDATKTVATGYGAADANAASAGTTLRSGIENYIGPTTKARVEKLYDAVDNLVNPNTLTPLQNTAAKVQEIMSRRSAAALPQESQAISQVLDAIQRPQGLSYEGIKTLRTSVGEMMKSSNLPANISQGELKALYGSLTKDLEGAVQNSGGTQALSAWQRANKYNTLVMDRRENLNRLLNVKSDEQLFNRVLGAASEKGGDIKLLSQVRKALPADEWNDLAASVINRIGRDAEGNLTPDRFVTAYGNLSPAGKSLLFRSTGQSALASSLDDIALISSRFKSLNQYANPSGTAQSVIGGATGFGALANPVATLTTLMSARVTSELLSRPQSARSIAKWSTAYYNAVARPTRATLQTLQQANRTFADDIGRQLGVPQHAEALFKQLNSVVGASAEDQRGQ